VIVYGDRERTLPAARALAELSATLEQAHEAAIPLERRARSAALVIDVGALVQALQDREFEARGEDELSELTRAGSAACLAAGRAFVALHRALPVDFDELARALEALRGLLPDVALRLRDPEGYAFYGLYPELYVEAASGLRDRAGDAPSSSLVQVVGIRSIGSSLASLVAAALGTPLPVVTVRPVGHPFARELRVGRELEQTLLCDLRERTYAIVDEGPGLSGSSFDAVAEYLCTRGVQREQVVLFPSHEGEPGGHASEAARLRYRGTRRLVQSYERYFDGSSDARSPARWFVDLTGAASEPVADLSAGRWRSLLYPEAALYPASYARDERRKYLVTSARGSWLLKYSGLGGSAASLAERARQLSEAGFIPELLAVRHGFSLSRFLRDARPLARTALPRELLVAHVARYLAFLATRFPAASAHGASPTQLLALSKQNASELWGSERAAALTRHDEELARLHASQRPTAGDSKLDVCEWLLGADGRLLKCDAEEHHAGHDCIGCQDPAWDVAGATIELGLDGAEREQVCAALFDAARLRLSDVKLRFYELAYAAFRAGRADFGERSLRGWADDDAARLARERARYAHEVELRLEG